MKYINARTFEQQILILMFILEHNRSMTGSMKSIIGASLSEPHTSWKNGTSVVFISIYVEIWINGTSVMHLWKFTFKNREIYFQMCVHHANAYQSSLLAFHLRLVRAFIVFVHEPLYQTVVVTNPIFRHTSFVHRPLLFCTLEWGSPQ